MNTEQLVSDIDDLCDEEAATGSTGHLANVRYVLEHLASYIARREQAIEARTAGCDDDALGIETRAEAHITQLAIDASAMVRPVQPQPVSTRRLPTLDDQDECGS